MNFFFLFAPKFLEWPLAICRELLIRKPESSFCGLVSGPRSVFDRVASSAMQNLTSLTWLDDLERKWLAQRCDVEKIKHYEGILGAQALNKIIIGDRQIGYGFITGGRIPATRLMDRAKDDELVTRYVIGLLDFLFETFHDRRPSLVFLYGVAGAVSIAVAGVCAHMGIPMVRLAPTRIGAHYILDDCPRGLLNPAKRLYEKSRKNPGLVKEEVESAEKYICSFREKPEKPEYARVNHARVVAGLTGTGLALTAVLNGKNILSALVRRRRQPLRSPGAFALASYRMSTAFKARSILRRNVFLQSGKVPQRDFVYFPLHVDPEASTMVLAPMHTDQTAVIEALVKSVPLHLKTVVKEHIPMLGRRPGGFYERIARMPGVLMASPFEDNMALIRRACAVCVISGTSAWEAILLRKPVLVVGDSPYLSLGEGIVHCPDLSKLPEALAKALKTPPAGDENLALFIASLLRVSFEFPTEVLWGKVTADTIRRHPAILKELCDRILQAVEKKGSNGETNRLEREESV
jgi:hypothetical protein